MNWFLLIFAYFGLFSLSLLDNGRGPAYPEILQHFGITPGKGAYFFSLASFAGIAVNYTGKYWLKVTGVVGAHRISLFLYFLAGTSIYYSASLVSFTWLMISSFLLGCGLSMMGISMNLMVVKGSSNSMKGRALNGLHAVYGATSFCVPFVYNFIISLWLSVATLFSIHRNCTTFYNFGFIFWRYKGRGKS